MDIAIPRLFSIQITSHTSPLFPRPPRLLPYLASPPSRPHKPPSDDVLFNSIPLSEHESLGTNIYSPIPNLQSSVTAPAANHVTSPLPLIPSDLHASNQTKPHQTIPDLPQGLRYKTQNPNRFSFVLDTCSQ